MNSCIETGKNRRSGLRYLKEAVTAVIWMFLIWYCASSVRELEMSLRSLTPAIPIVSALYIINNYIRSELVRKIYMAGGLKISPMESFLTVFVASSLNFIIPFKPGSIYSAVHMRMRHNLEYNKFASTLVVFGAHAFTASLMLTIVALMFIGLLHDNWNWYLNTLLLVLLLSMFMFFCWDMRQIQILNWTAAGRYANRLLENTKSIINEYRLLFYAIVSVSLLTATNSITLYYVLKSIDEGGELLPLYLLALSQTLSGFVSLTPGAVGVQEATAAVMYNLIEIEPSQLVLVVFTIRVIRILTIGVLLVPFHIILQKCYGHH